ncbi:MAG: hypothetical protein JSU69_06990 [Candidatus Zixiibacteriota bacterium]|nr:MAG: hypothetical protein JSU69_06990 [candidate division Zixibacteria bacterium]
MVFDDDEASDLTAGSRYLPDLHIGTPLGDRYLLDLEVSLNGYATAMFPARDDLDADGKVKLYRLWIRFSTSRLEARLGLQKINFGSATLLRPLMWFDRIDARDPLKITDGVYALLLRYYFLNNANIWLWGLYGNDEPKGWEKYATDDETPEFGGRVQLPVPGGELAVSYHHRRAQLSGGSDIAVPREGDKFPENRFALDGKWDIGVGLWLEGVLIHQNARSLSYRWRRLVNVGVDYTFELGSGVSVLGEHIIIDRSRKALGSGSGANMSALSVSYSLGVIDYVSGIVYYDWDNEQFYRLVDWRRTYDDWIIHVIGFWNPESRQIYQDGGGNALYGGKGVQLMVVYNH